MPQDAYVPPDYIRERLLLPDAAFLLDFYLKQHREHFEHWEQDPSERTWRASSLGNCLRAQTLERRGIPSTRVFDDKTLRAFAWGDEVHKWVRTMFWRLGLVVAEEPAFSWPEQDIVGHLDLVWNPAGSNLPMKEEWSDDWVLFLGRLRDNLQSTLGGMYGVREPLDSPDLYERDEDVPVSDPHIPDMLIGTELKSAHSLAMKRLINEGPYVHHRYQAGIYHQMRMTTPGPLTDKKSDITWDPAAIERFTLTYVGKDSVGLLTFEIEDEWVNDAVERVQELNHYWERDAFPPCSCVDWQVGYCGYAEGDTCCGRNLKGRVAADIRKTWEGGKEDAGSRGSKHHLRSV